MLNTAVFSTFEIASPMIDHQYYVIPGRIGPNLCKFVKSVVPFLSRNKSISKSLPCGPSPQNMARALMPRQPYSVAVPNTGWRLPPLVPEGREAW